MTDPLLRLFGNAPRVKLMRLFLFNPADSFSAADAARRARITPRASLKEIKVLLQVGLIKRARRSHPAKFILNENFAHRMALQSLLFNAAARAGELPARMRGVGALRLIVVSGIFMGDWGAGLDLLLVGERLNERRLRAKVRALEGELGRELRYAVMPTNDFLYRLNISDKLLRDVLDYSHTVVLDRLQVGLK